MNALIEPEKSWGERFALLAGEFSSSNHESARALRALLTEAPSAF